MPSGSCLCGNIQYEYTGEPDLKANCQCLTCRKISGGTHTVCASVPTKNFTIKSGTPKTYTAKHETGLHLTMSFCDNCGVTCSKTADAPDMLETVIVLAGTLDGDGLENVKPEAELWNNHRVSWLTKQEDAKQFAGFPQMG